MSAVPPTLRDDFRREPPYPPDFLFLEKDWSGVGDLEDLRGLERRLTAEHLVPLSYLRLHGRLGFALLTMDMQHRWRNAYQKTLQENRALLTLLASVADAEPIVLIDGVAALCTVHPDPGTRPLGLTKPPAVPFEVAAYVTCQPRADRPHLPIRLDASACIARAVRIAPATEEKASADVGPIEFIPAVDIAAPPPGTQMDRPEIMRPLQRGERAEVEALAAHPNVRVLAPHDALLLAVVQADGGPMSGLRWWELSELTRRSEVDYEALVHEARRLGLRTVAHRLLATLATTWRAPVPEAVLRRLAPGPLLRTALRMAPSGSSLERLLLGLPIAGS